MNISKTTINFARKRGLDITVEDIGDKVLLCVWEIENDCEWLFSYRIDGEFLHFNRNVYLAQSAKEELPATVFDEKQLRKVIDFVASELNSTNC